MTSKVSIHYSFAARDFAVATLQALTARNAFLIGVQMLPDMASSMPWANASTGYILSIKGEQAQVMTHPQVIAFAFTLPPTRLDKVIAILEEKRQEAGALGKRATTSMAEKEFWKGEADGIYESLKYIKAYQAEAKEEAEAKERASLNGVSMEEPAPPPAGAYVADTLMDGLGRLMAIEEKTWNAAKGLEARAFAAGRVKALEAAIEMAQFYKAIEDAK